MSLRSSVFPVFPGVLVLALGIAALASEAKAATVQNWDIGLPQAASPVMEELTQFHFWLLGVVAAVALLVAVLLLYVMFRFSQRRNPLPSPARNNKVLEVALLVLPVLILAAIAIPSVKLLYFETAIPKPDVIIKAVGHHGYWTYAYTSEGGFQFDSNMLSAAAAKEQGKPRLSGVDNPVYVPVNKAVEVVTTGGDVIYSWAVPAFGVKVDAIPGRLNHIWFKATRIGTYYGQCLEPCGANHAFMPIEVRVVSEADYQNWLEDAKARYAADGTPFLASP